MLAGTVDLIERLGNETIISVMLSSGQPVVASLDGNAVVALNDQIKFGFAADDVSIFNAAGNAI